MNADKPARRPKRPCASPGATPPPPADGYVLRLFVSGITPRSQRALENIKKICETHLKGHYDLQVVDIYQKPDLARSADIVAAPTLIKQLPLPLRRFVGDLSETERVLMGLDLIPRPRPPR